MFRAVCSSKQTILKTFRRSASTISATPAVANVASRWKTLSAEEQAGITKRLDELQKQDWNKLSLEEKKAAYYIAFGSYGPRESLFKSGHATKVLVGVSGAVVISAGFFALTKKAVTEKPHTINKEWEEATNEKMREKNVNPITGVSSEGYSGKGYVVSDK